MDPGIGDLTGDLPINDDKIEDVGPDLAVADGAAEAVDASGKIAIPGFVDTHRHVYQNLLRGLGSDWSLAQYCVAMAQVLGPNFTAEDMYIANYLGALDAGVTAVFDWSHNQVTPEHTDELVRGLRDAGIRATFGYGGSMEQWAECMAPPYSSTTHTNAQEAWHLRNGGFCSASGLLTLGLAARGPEFSSMDVVKADWGAGPGA